MTKEGLDQFRERMVGSAASYVARDVADALEQAWAERDALKAELEHAIKSKGFLLTQNSDLIEDIAAIRGDKARLLEEKEAEIASLKAKVEELREEIITIELRYERFL